LNTLLINTANSGKLAEYRRLFAEYDIDVRATHVDVEEIDATPLEVVSHKACQVREEVLVDDTSLEIEGADVGVHVRWRMGELVRYVGKKAKCAVLLAYRKQDFVYVCEGVVDGRIASASGDGGFGFDPYFVPEGSEKTLAEFKPDCYNPRALAVKAFVEKRLNRYPALFDWEGPWQKG